MLALFIALCTMTIIYVICEESRKIRNAIHAVNARKLKDLDI